MLTLRLCCKLIWEGQPSNLSFADCFPYQTPNFDRGYSKPRLFNSLILFAALIMLRLFIRNSIHILSTIRHKSNPTATTHLHFLYKYSAISQIPHDDDDEGAPNNKNGGHSSSLSTVSYLINTCGLSPQSALSASKKIDIKSTEKADCVLNAIKSYGFTRTQMAKLIEKYPVLLSFDADRIVRPKLEFFLGIGYSGDQLTELISSCPRLLMSSLHNSLKPNFELLRSILGSSDQIAIVVRRARWLILNNPHTGLLPNIQTLKCYGVPKPNIAKFITLYPRAAMQSTGQFKMNVESVRKMGFNPLSTMFVRAVGVMSCLSSSAWERKVAFYKSLGWSGEEVISAFSKHPMCMGLSEEKIKQLMDFYVNKMHLVPSFISEKPVLLGFSLEKRVIPRCSVLRVLASKGLVKRNSSMRFLSISEKDFLNKYVINYQDQVPEVLEAYNRSVGYVELKGEP